MPTDSEILNWIEQQWREQLGSGPVQDAACEVHCGKPLRDAIVPYLAVAEAGPVRPMEQPAPEGKGYEIRVTDPKSPYCGQVLRGCIIYYDIKHTGDGPDLILAVNQEGKSIRLLSSQCDMAHYEAQKIAEHIERLGANVGDFVRIVKTGSGSYKQGWETEGIHRITRIDPTGHVEFDDGLGTIFRPIVEVIGVAGARSTISGNEVRSS